MSAIYVNGHPRALTAPHTLLDLDLGVHSLPDGSVRFWTRRGVHRKIAVKFGRSRTSAWEGEGYLPPRAILTVRPTSPKPTQGLLRPYGKTWSHNEPGGKDISPCGDGDILAHDAIMQRCPVGLYSPTGDLRRDVQRNGYYHLSRGWQKVTTLPDYAVPVSQDPYDDRRQPLNEPGTETDPAIAALLPYDGQHLVRAYRCGLLCQTDEAVAMDLKALAGDAALAWDAMRTTAHLSSPAAQGSGDVGREWAWVAQLAGTVNPRSTLSRNLGLIAAHVQRPNGLMQALRMGSFWGSPDPWAPPNTGGSGVPEGAVVAQDLECYAQIVGLYSLHLEQLALPLCATVLDQPKAKWIDVATGAGVGVHGPAIDQAWPALGIYARISTEKGLAAMKRWRIPTAQGSSVGPFSDPADILAALRAWGDHGKARWAIQALGGAVQP